MSIIYYNIFVRQKKSKKLKHYLVFVLSCLVFLYLCYVVLMHVLNHQLPSQETQNVLYHSFQKSAELVIINT